MKSENKYKKMNLHSNKERENRIEIIRAFAIITVVLGHSIILYAKEFDAYQPQQTSTFFACAKRFINLYQMPLFFSVSGYLFAKSAGKESAVSFFLKKAKRILLPFLLVGLFWMIPIKLFAQYPPYAGCSIKGTVVMFLLGTDPGHLWFLPVLFLYFVISYCFVRLFRNKSAVWALAFLAGLGCSILEPSPSKMPFNSYYPLYFMRYFWSFPFGALMFWLKKHIDCAAGKPLLKLMTALGCTAVACTAVFAEEKLSLLASVIIVFSTYFLAPEKNSVLAKIISKNSFGLYLFHSPLIYLTFRYALNYSPAAVFSINLLIWGSLSFLLTSLLRKTPLKVAIGE